MSQEIPQALEETQFIRPSTSRKLMIRFIRNFGREENPDLPPQPVPITRALEFESQNNLWFGPEVSAINFIYAKGILGLLKIDGQNDTVIYTGSRPPDKLKSQTLT